jgi:hypothetical protein
MLSKEEVMKRRRFIWTGIPLMILLVFGQNVFAAICDDPAAMPAFHNWAPIDFGSDGVNDGHIDYAVYEPGQYDSFINQYIYAYQIFNDSASVGIDYFSVGFSPDAPAIQALYDLSRSTAEPGGSIPDISNVLTQSVIHIFQRDCIDSGEHSRTLLFTSNYGPQMAWGIVSGGVTGGAIVHVPSPSLVPEPTTMGLFIGGAFLAFQRRRNKYGKKQIAETTGDTNL